MSSISGRISLAEKEQASLQGKDLVCYGVAAAAAVAAVALGCLFGFNSYGFILSAVAAGSLTLGGFTYTHEKNRADSLIVKLGSLEERERDRLTEEEFEKEQSKKFYELCHSEGSSKEQLREFLIQNPEFQKHIAEEDLSDLL